MNEIDIICKNKLRETIIKEPKVWNRFILSKTDTPVTEITITNSTRDLMLVDAVEFFHGVASVGSVRVSFYTNTGTNIYWMSFPLYPFATSDARGFHEFIRPIVLYKNYYCILQSSVSGLNFGRLSCRD